MTGGVRLRGKVCGYRGHLDFLLNVINGWPLPTTLLINLPLTKPTTHLINPQINDNKNPPLKKFIAAVYCKNLQYIVYCSKKTEKNLFDHKYIILKRRKISKALNTFLNVHDLVGRLQHN